MIEDWKFHRAPGNNAYIMMAADNSLYIGIAADARPEPRYNGSAEMVVGAGIYPLTPAAERFWQERVREVFPHAEITVNFAGKKLLYLSEPDFAVFKMQAG